MTLTGDGKTSAIEFEPTFMGVWVKARLKEMLQPEIYHQIDDVKVEHIKRSNTNLCHMVVYRYGRSEGFRFTATLYTASLHRLVVDEPSLAQLILFLQ